jgi:hypothetical protein
MYVYTASLFSAYAHFSSPVCIPSGYNDLDSKLQRLQRNLQLQSNELLVAISIRSITTNPCIFYVRSLIVYIGVTGYMSVIAIRLY